MAFLIAKESRTLESTFSVDGPEVTEGDSGTQNGTFVITSSRIFPFNVDFNYNTVDGTATAPGDYTATSGVGTLLAGQSSVNIDVPVVGDAVSESEEAFTLVCKSFRKA